MKDERAQGSHPVEARDGPHPSLAGVEFLERFQLHEWAQVFDGSVAHAEPPKPGEIPEWREIFDVRPREIELFDVSESGEGVEILHLVVRQIDLLQVFESSQRREVGELGSAHDETPEVRGCPKGGEILEGCGLDLQGLQLSQILFSREPGKRIALESHVLQTTQTNGLRRVEVGAVATFQITCIDIKPLSARGHRLGAMDGKRGLFGGGALRSIIGQSAEDLLQSALDDQRSTETLRHDSAVDQTTVGGARVGALRAEELQLTRRVLDDCPSPLREDLRDLFGMSCTFRGLTAGGGASPDQGKRAGG